MKVILSDFKLWRRKKISCFIICIFGALILAICTENKEKIGVFVLISLIIYSCVIELPFVKKNYVAHVENKEQDILITMNGKTVKIKKNEIEKVYMKEMRYGGRWLETIGQRLIVSTKQKKYYFDSAFIKENNNDNTDIYKLYNLVKENKNNLVKCKCEEVPIRKTQFKSRK